MLEKHIIVELAQRLDQAEKSRTQIRQFSLEYPDLSIEEAYMIQKHWIHLKSKAGREVKGHKIGLTSRAMQVASDMKEPDYGALIDDMFFADGCALPIERFIAPRVEAELAFILGKPLSGPRCNIFDVLNAVEYVTPAVEIIDARIQRLDPETKATRKVTDTIADNAAGAGLLLGGRAFKPLDGDMRSITALMYRNGAIEETGIAAAVLNHPANGVAWLANRLAPYGDTLKAGEIILGGSFTRAVPAYAGDTFHVDYGPYGAISWQFV